MSHRGRIYLIPCPLGEVPPNNVLPLSISKVIDSIDHYVVEHEKNARKFIKSICPSKKQSDLQINTINKFTNPTDLPKFIDPCFEGADLGIISDAGCPGVADPGAEIIGLAHEHGIQVIPMVGPSSILLGLMASGLNGQQFAFHGYLPIDKQDRKRTLKQLEKQSQQLQQTQIFIETPYRNNQMLEALIQTLAKKTRLCVACNLGEVDEFIQTKTIDRWKMNPVDLHKRPCIFLFQSD
ncbi:MAG: SAM-dependent methyltransferase [Flavobacteriaceae bacterium]|nr:SAM-dependent methyltransferase [Flavobacteriaceae bacterium]